MATSIMTSHQAQCVAGMDVESMALQKASTHQVFSKTSLYVKMGKDVALINLVRRFYELVLEDMHLRHLWEAVKHINNDSCSLDRFKMTQVHFLTLYFGNLWSLEESTAPGISIHDFWVAQLAPLLESNLVHAWHIELAMSYICEACADVGISKATTCAILDRLSFLPSILEGYTQGSSTQVVSEQAEPVVEQASGPSPSPCCAESLSSSPPGLTSLSEHSSGSQTLSSQTSTTTSRSFSMASMELRSKRRRRYHAGGGGFRWKA